MIVIATNNPLIRCARIENDQDGDAIVVMETTAELDCNAPGFNQAHRDSVENVFFEIIRKNGLLGGKLKQLPL